MIFFIMYLGNDTGNRCPLIRKYFSKIFSLWWKFLFAVVVKRDNEDKMPTAQVSLLNLSVVDNNSAGTVIS
uniref:Uncharacterized protein n=1 Tax=Anguilla anguilla TaxID=7936 RepID=A0A0E9VI33_ANGAN